MGLPVDHPAIPAEIRPKIAAAIQHAEEEFARTNATIRQMSASPADSSAFVAQLKEGSVAGVVIGNGVRSNPGLTVFFEQLVDLVHVHAPQAKLMFNTKPDDTLEAIQRWFPQIKIVS